MGALDDPEHPRFLAFEWLADNDPFHVCPDDENLDQRYVMGFLYFATDGDEWVKCRRNGMVTCGGENFLSSAHECTWGGVTCDSLNRIHKLNMGKYHDEGI